MTQLKIGDFAPEINSIDQNGDNITLKQFKGKKDSSLFLSKRHDSRLYCAVM